VKQVGAYICIAYYNVINGRCPSQEYAIRKTLGNQCRTLYKVIASAIVVWMRDLGGVIAGCKENSNGGDQISEKCKRMHKSESYEK